VSKGAPAVWTLSPELRAVEARLFRALRDRGARIVRRHVPLSPSRAY